MATSGNVLTSSPILPYLTGTFGHDAIYLGKGAHPGRGQRAGGGGSPQHGDELLDGGDFPDALRGGSDLRVSQNGDIELTRRDWQQGEFGVHPLVHAGSEAMARPSGRLTLPNGSAEGIGGGSEGAVGRRRERGGRGQGRPRRTATGRRAEPGGGDWRV
ncbi:MAG: hypothetical protein ABEJ96_09525 [Thiohalorhabdaceae bacterium]